MVCPVPCGIRAKRSVFGFATSFFIAAKSRANNFKLFSHAFPFGGSGLSGQYPAGQSGEACFGSRENSRMSHCAMRMCSNNSHSERGMPLGRTPRSFGGIPSNAAFQSTCAPRPESRFVRCSRNRFSLTGYSRSVTPVQFAFGFPATGRAGPWIMHAANWEVPPQACSNFSDSALISSIVLGRPFPDPGKTRNKIPLLAPPLRASDRIPRFSASAIEPSPILSGGPTSPKIAYELLLFR